MAGHRDRLLHGLPVHERCLQVNGVRTAVLEAGSGPSLLLLHGGVECGGVYWAPIIGALARRYHVVAPDVPGLGESEAVRRMDLAAFTDWFAAALRLLCPVPPTVVAHSLLGSFAVRFAASHGHLLQQLLVYAAPAVGPYRIPLGLLITAIRFDLRPTAANNERFEHWAFVDRERARRRDTDWFDAWRAYSLARAITPPVKRTMRQLIRAGARQAPDQALRNIAIPTALLWGRHDRFVSFRLAEAASARLRWPLHVIENAGHVPHIEQPDAFLTSLERALALPHRKGATDADSQFEREVAAVGRARGRV